jgi:hypothetical protein
MFDTSIFILNNYKADDKQIISAVNQASALKLYRTAAASGQLKGFINLLTGKQKKLQDLSELRGAKALNGGHYAGIKTVSLDKIKGSEGRSKDFDGDFRPLKAHNRQRWMNVAKARFDGHDLPPVELIRFQRDYYVRDGHHRISVARALGQQAIEAYVIEIE